jgi:predicted NAD/FAD-dependent oxidoreductase
MALLEESRIARDNLSIKDDLVQRMNSIESQTLAWIATAKTLEGTVDKADQIVVSALKAQFSSKLTAAVQN